MNVAPCELLGYRVLTANVCGDLDFIPTLLQALQNKVTDRIHAKDSISADVENRSSVLAGGCTDSLYQLVHGRLSFIGAHCHGGPGRTISSREQGSERHPNLFVGKCAPVKRR